MVERCITIAKRGLPAKEAADKLKPSAERNSTEWKNWRKSDKWQEWAKTVAPYVAARRRVFSILRDKEAVKELEEEKLPEGHRWLVARDERRTMLFLSSCALDSKTWREARSAALRLARRAFRATA